MKYIILFLIVLMAGCSNENTLDESNFYAALKTYIHVSKRCDYLKETLGLNYKTEWVDEDANKFEINCVLDRNPNIYFDKNTIQAAAFSVFLYKYKKEAINFFNCKQAYKENCKDIFKNLTIEEKEFFF